MTPRRKISMQIPALLLAWAGMTGCTDHRNPSYAPYASLELPTTTPVDGRVTVRFFGVSTLLFDDGANALMIDGFFSRPGPLQVAAGKIRPADDQIAYALQNGGNITRLDALFVAHSHYDHALDSARIARRTGAKLAGSRSTANLGHGEGLVPERICVFKPGETYTFGDFRITPYQSPHSPDPPFEGHIEKPLSPPAHVSQYREGGNYSFLISHRDVTALVHPSTNYKDGALGDASADVVFLGIGKLGQQDEAFLKTYWRGVVTKTRGKGRDPDPLGRLYASAQSGTETDAENR